MNKALWCWAMLNDFYMIKNTCVYVGEIEEYIFKLRTFWTLHQLLFIPQISSLWKSSFLCDIKLKAQEVNKGVALHVSVSVQQPRKLDPESLASLSSPASHTSVSVASLCLAHSHSPSHFLCSPFLPFFRVLALICPLAQTTWGLSHQTRTGRLSRWCCPSCWLELLSSFVVVCYQTSLPTNCISGFYVFGCFPSWISPSSFSLPVKFTSRPCLVTNPCYEPEYVIVFCLFKPQYTPFEIILVSRITHEVQTVTVLSWACQSSRKTNSK